MSHENYVKENWPFIDGGTDRVCFVDAAGGLNTASSLTYSETARNLTVSSSTTSAQMNVQSSSSDAEFSIYRTTNDEWGGFLNLMKARGGGIVSQDDVLGSILWKGHDSAGYQTSAEIKAIVDAAVGGAGDVPTRLSFFTRADGAGTTQEHLTLKESLRTGFNTPTPEGAFHVRSDGTNNAYNYFEAAVDSGQGCFLGIRKTRGTLASKSAVSEDDNLGKIEFLGWDGDGYIGAAQISVDVDAPTGDDDVAGRMVFAVTPDGSTTPVAAIAIRQSGAVALGGLNPVTEFDVLRDSANCSIGARTTTSGDSALKLDSGDGDYSSDTTWTFTNARGSGDLYISYNAMDVFTLKADGSAGIGTGGPSSNADLTLEGGVLNLKETTTPTQDGNYGKIYCKNDDKLYFQDGSGVEHEIAVIS